MAVLRLPVVLTHAQAQACRQQLTQAMAVSQDRVLLIDASDLTQFDSSALAVLLACRREAFAVGRQLELRGLPDKLRELASLYGVLPLLQTGPDRSPGVPEA
jgi:phospholipid transport system transporter-binding protein